MRGYDRNRTLTPEDRVIRWIGSVTPRYPRGVPVDRFVRQLKGDLTGLTYGQLDQVLKSLEGKGLVRREWDSPGEYRVFLTDLGATRYQALGEPPPPAPPPGTPPFTPAPIPPRPVRPPDNDASPPYRSLGPPPPSAAPPPAPVVPAYRPVPLTPPPAPEAPPGEVTPLPAPLPSSSIGYLAAPAPEAPAATEAETGALRGASSGPIPSRGPPSSANLPVRVMLYCLLYGAGKGEAFPVVPGEDLSRYLLNQGFTLSEDDLRQVLASLHDREYLSLLPRSDGRNFDLQLSTRGHAMAEGLISGQAPGADLGENVAPSVPPPSPSPSPGTGEVAVPPGPASDDALRREAETLRAENQALREALSSSEERRTQDRETLDEVLHQIELQDQKVRELQELISKLSRAPSAPRSQ